MMEVSLQRLARTYCRWHCGDASAGMRESHVDNKQLWDTAPTTNYFIKNHVARLTKRGWHTARGRPTDTVGHHAFHVAPRPRCMVRLTQAQWRRLLAIEARDQKNK